MAFLWVDVLADIAFGALAILVTLLAIYLSLKLLGKLAKFAITIVVIVLVVWLIFSEHSFLYEVIHGFLYDMQAVLPIPRFL